MRKLIAAAATLAIAVTVGACSGGDGAAGSSAESLVSAISKRVAEEGTAKVTFTVDVAGQKIVGKGAGRFVEGDRASEVKIEASGQKTEIRFIGDTSYVKAPEYLASMMKKGKTWVDLSDEKSAQMLGGMAGLAKQGDLAHALAQIKRAGTVAKSEETEVDGRAATQHTITMAVDKLDEFPLGLGKEYKEKFKAAGVKSYQVKLAVDEQNLPLQMTMDLAELYAALTAGQPQPPGPPGASTPEAPKAKASVTVKFSEWGTPVEVEVPPKDKIGTIQQAQTPQQPKPSK